MPDCDESYLVCNADESEPGTCKDRDILRFNRARPDRGYGNRLLCDRCPARDTPTSARNSVTSRTAGSRGALREAYENGMLGSDIQGSGVTVYLHDTLGAGAYICGEETALLESLEGKKGFPRFKPPFPANYGLWGRPTTVNNVETLALVPGILREETGLAGRDGKEPRHPVLLGVRPRLPARQSRTSAWHPVRRPARTVRRSLEKSRTQGGHSGRLLGPGASRQDHDGA